MRLLTGHTLVGLFLGLLTLAGCEAPNGRRLDLSKTFSATASGNDDLEARHRKEFQTRRTRKSMRWLMTNRIDSGMAKIDVDRVLGETGVYEENPGWLRQKGGSYRIDDKVYRYGPDDRGESVYLFFRENVLVNFDPQQFAEKPAFNSMKR